MSGLLQEKFQITVPAKKEAGHDWDTFKKNRDTHGVDAGCDKFNDMPPGMDIDDQCRPAPGKFACNLAGESDVSANMVAKSAMVKGYARIKMGATDDQYTGEHVDLFYGEAKDEDGNVGFAERNNYLDRE